MKLKYPLVFFTIAAMGAVMFPISSSAQTNPEFIKLPGRVIGALYRPDSGPAPHVAFVIANGGSNILGAPQCRELAARGFMVFCQNTVLEGDQKSANWDDSPLDFKDTIPFLRKQPGIKKVVLYGHSGGGSHMAYYQAVAEAGAAFCQDQKKLSKCSDKVNGVPKADGIVFVDAHPGFAVQNLRELNPSVIVDEDNPAHTHIDADLDPFSAAHGFNALGATHFSKSFVATYTTAQAKRETELIDRAQGMIAAIKDGRARGPLRDLMILPGNGDAWTEGAPLSPTDYDIPNTMVSRHPEKLMKNDGSIVVEIVHSVAVPNEEEHNLPRHNSALEGVKFVTPETFLSMDAIRATNSLEEIDWCTSNTSVTCNVEHITVPAMVAAMGAYKFIGDTERLYDHLAAADKDYIVIEGALHSYGECKPCEKKPGEYANSQKNLFDYIRDWTNKRF
jgi:pimeloyl-ACP methyl ester carboxylesterase